MRVPLQDREEADVESHEALFLAILEHRNFNAFVSSVLTKLRQLKASESHLGVLPVIIIVHDSEVELIGKGIDEDELRLHPCRVGAEVSARFSLSVP